MTVRGLLVGSRDRNGSDLKPRARIDWRTSLVPAPAVIPAPIAYIKVVAVKKLVVGFRAGSRVVPLKLRGATCGWLALPRGGRSSVPLIGCAGLGGRDFEKIGVFKAGVNLE